MIVTVAARSIGLPDTPVDEAHAGAEHGEKSNAAHRCGKHDAAAPCLVQGQVRDRQDAAHHPGLWSSPMISTNCSSSVRRRPWMP